MLTELGKYCFVNLPPAKRPAKTRRRILYRTIRKLFQRPPIVALLPWWVTMAMFLITGLVWAHSERDSGLRKFFAVIAGACAAICASQLLQHFFPVMG
jgi:hypothetical protein